MALPLILGIGAAIAGTTGIGAGINGLFKMKKANDTMQSAELRHERNMAKFKADNDAANADMDKLGTLELEILRSFSEFSDIFEKIKNKPVFEAYSRNDISLPKYDGEKIKEVSIGAGALLGGLGGAGLGTFGGFAAAGAATAAVMAFGTASTGTAIASLSGAALTNATLAALGGGAIAAGGGGIALGTTVLGVTTLGAGLLVGGIIFSFTGEKLSDKADEAWAQTETEETKINKILFYLADLRNTANKYYDTLHDVNAVYLDHLSKMKTMVISFGHSDWNSFNTEEKQLTENTILLVGLLYNMCKLELVLKGDNEDNINTVNKTEAEKSINSANFVLTEKFKNKCQV